jgi:hypothetical protein
VNVIYAYPWDVVGDPAAPGRLAGLGVDAVALAASYHAVRAATPLHPSHRVVDAHAAIYVPVRPAAWGRLVPAAPTWTPPDAFARAGDALRRAGLAVHAWIALTHNSRLGSAHPDLTVRNAFGDAYPYALCPAHPDVAGYCATLVREIVELGEPDGVILEGCGPLGFRHDGLHEKTAGADWSAAHLDLLSLCFCAACARRYPAQVRARVRAGIDGAPGSVEDALGDLAPAVREVRTGLAASLRRIVLRETRDLPVALHANPSPWAAGSAASVTPGTKADVLVGNCWGDPGGDAANLRRLRGLAAPGTRVGAYVLTLPPRSADPEDLLAHLARYQQAGATDLHFYHGGLASPARLNAVAAALKRLRA